MGWTEQIVSLTEQFDEFRRVGTDGDAAVRRWIVEELARHGVEAVDEPFEIETRHCTSWQFTVDGVETPSFFMNGAEFTGPNGVTAELVYVGNVLGVDVEVDGKIVVMDLQNGPVLPGRVIESIADYAYDPDGVMAAGTLGGQGGPAPRNFPAPYYEAADRGAVGFVAILDGREADDDTFFADPTGRVHPRVPGVFLKGSVGAQLKEQMATATTTATIVLEGETRSSTSGNVVVHIPGQKSDAVIVNTHHDGGWSGAVQDAAGVAEVMGLATFYSRFPSNYIQKDLWFVIDGGHYGWNYPYGANEFAATHPGLLDRTCLAVGVEHIGKRFVGRGGELVDTGEVEPRMLYAPRNQLLFDAAVAAIENNDLVSTVIPKAGALPLFGETQSFFLQGVPSFSLISFPEYLFFASDTIDKVADDQLQPVLSAVLDIVDAAMYLPATWLTHIDR